MPRLRHERIWRKVRNWTFLNSLILIIDQGNVFVNDIIAHYYTLLVDGKENVDAAWYYPEPNPAAQKIAGKVAFWRGIPIEA
jgi:Domain of unknown function (DUF427)